MNLILVFSVVVLTVLVLLSYRKIAVLNFKCSYYEQKLKNRGVDISSVENITFKQMIEM